MKTFDFQVEFHWNMFLGLIDNESTPIQAMASCLIGDKPLPEPVYWWIYMSLGLNELTYASTDDSIYVWYIILW